MFLSGVPSRQEIARRVAARKGDGWALVDGVWLNPAAKDLEIEEVEGLYRVRRRPGFGEWDTVDLQEAFRIAGEIRSSLDAFEAWRQAGFRHVTKFDGLLISVEKKAGEEGASARVTGKGDREKGLYGFCLTRWPGSYVLGTPTVNGSVSLDRSIRGRGVCRALYDAVEAACGMPVVPHGRNFVPGALNELSGRFWAKRIMERAVPGHGDPSAEARRREVEHGTRYVRSESSALIPEFAIEVARATGWQIRGVAYDDDPERLPQEAWCLAGDGVAFGPGGYFREADLFLGKGRIADCDRGRMEEAFGGERLSGFFMVSAGREAERAALLMERYRVPRAAPAPEAVAP